MKLDDYTLRFKEYAKQSGLDFTDEVSYGLTQILKDNAVTLSNRVQVKERLADAFVLQSKNDPTVKTLSKKQALNIAHEYLNSSTSLRNNSIWAPENSGLPAEVLGSPATRLSANAACSGLNSGVCP